MQNTKIEWTEMSWNPVTGCKHNCYFCYARDIMKRFKKSFNPEFHEDRINQPLKIKKPKMIFVCSMADLFGDWVPIEWIEKVKAIVEQTPHLTYQFLTKNPKRYSEFVWPNNAWIGATAINQKMADNAINELKKAKAKIKFLSCEPLSDSIRLSGANTINWLIIGACTGRHAFQPDKTWVQNLTNDGRKFNHAIFYKPNLQWQNPPREYPNLITK